MGVLAALHSWPRSRHASAKGVLHILLVVAIQLAGVTMQGKFFPYHYGASLLLGAFLAGLGAYKLWQRALAKGWLGVVAFAALVPDRLLREIGHA